MEGFSMYLDLASFFSDFRAKSLIYVDTSAMKTIAHVENHVKTLFDIDVDICFLFDNHFLPSKEDSRVLKNSNSLKVVPVPGIAQSGDTDREHFDNNGQHQRKGRHDDKNSDVDIVMLDADQCDDVLQITKEKKRKVKKHKKKRTCSEDGNIDIDCINDTFQNSLSSSISESFSGKVKAKKKKHSKEKSSPFTSISKPFEEYGENADDHEHSSGNAAPLNGTRITTFTNSHAQDGSEQFTERPALEKEGTNHSVDRDINCDNVSVEGTQDCVNEVASLSIVGPEESNIDSDTQLSEEKNLETPTVGNRKRKRKRPGKSTRKKQIRDQPAEKEEADLQKKTWSECLPPQSSMNMKHIYFSDESEDVPQKVVYGVTADSEINEELLREMCHENLEMATNEETTEKIDEEKACEDTTEKMAVKSSSKPSCDSGDSAGARREMFAGPWQSAVSGDVGKLQSLSKNNGPVVLSNQKGTANLAPTPNQTVLAKSASPSSAPVNLSDRLKGKEKVHSKRKRSPSTSNSEPADGQRRSSLSGIHKTTFTNSTTQDACEEFAEGPSVEKGKANDSAKRDINVCVERTHKTRNETAGHEESEVYLISPEFEEEDPWDCVITGELYDPHFQKKKNRKRKRRNKTWRKKQTIPPSPAEVEVRDSIMALFERIPPQPLSTNTEHTHSSHDTLPRCEDVAKKMVYEDTADNEINQEILIKIFDNEQSCEKMCTEKIEEETTSQEITENKTVESSSLGGSLGPTKEAFRGPRTPRLSAASGGIGKLLSLLRNDSPVVFSRQKTTPDVAPTPAVAPTTAVAPTPAVAPKPNQAVSENSKPTTCSKSKKPFPICCLDVLAQAKSYVPSSNASSTKFVPKEKSKISFKMLKMSDSYCPEMSSSIVAVVEKVVRESEEVTLRLISGAEECMGPKGKFNLDEDGPGHDVPPKTIQLKWGELIEPRECT